MVTVIVINNYSNRYRNNIVLVRVIVIVIVVVMVITALVTVYTLRRKTLRAQDGTWTSRDWMRALSRP